MARREQVYELPSSMPVTLPDSSPAAVLTSSRLGSPSRRGSQRSTKEKKEVRVPSGGSQVNWNPEGMDTLERDWGTPESKEDMENRKVQWNLPMTDTLGPFKLSLIERCSLFGGQIVH